jgi:hypothetical protein
MVSFRKQTAINTVVVVEENEPLYPIDRTVNKYSYYIKPVWRFFKKLKTEIPCDTDIPLLEFLREMRSADIRRET